MSIGERSLQFLFTPGKGGVYLNQEYTIPAPGMQINFTSRRKASQNFNEKGKKHLTAGDRRGIVALPVKRGFFLLSGYGVRGADPSTCGTQGGSKPISTVPSGRVSAPFGAGFRLKTGRVRRFLFGFRPCQIKKEVPNNMAAKAGARIKITLRCSECKQRNYNTFKNKKNTPDRLELNKYCPFCRKHTVHNETK